jgi:hypothetical protein
MRPVARDEICVDENKWSIMKAEQKTLLNKRSEIFENNR